MISEELKSLIEKINGQGIMRYSDGATEEQILMFEKEHKITLPTQYKEWLLYSDGGYLCLPAGIQLYGVSHKPMICINDNTRPSDDNDQPSDRYIVIGALATGDPIICEKEGERISIYNHEAGRIEPDETYPDFYSFIGDLEGILGLGD